MSTKNTATKFTNATDLQSAGHIGEDSHESNQPREEK